MCAAVYNAQLMVVQPAVVLKILEGIACFLSVNPAFPVC